MKSLRVSRRWCALRWDPATTRAPDLGFTSNSVLSLVAAIESTQRKALLDSAEHQGTAARKEGEQRAESVDREATGEPDDARVRDESSRWAVGHSYFPSFSCFCCQSEMMDVKNWRLWIGKPDLSALSGVSPARDGAQRACTEPLLATCIARYGGPERGAKPRTLWGSFTGWGR